MKNCPRGKVRWKGKGEEPWRPLPPPHPNKHWRGRHFSGASLGWPVCAWLPWASPRFVSALPASALSSGEFLQTYIIVCVLQCPKHSRLPKINRTEALFTGSP